MPPDQRTVQNDPLFAALIERTASEAASLLFRVAGTHALLLDGVGGRTPHAAGLGCWTELRFSMSNEFNGPLRAETGALPFCDNSFGAVLIRHLAGVGVPPQSLALEAARVLAPHGVLLVIECHPFSGWTAWLRKQRQRGGSALRAVGAGRWRSVLRAAGLAVGDPLRCGAPWPTTRNMPRRLERLCGGAWLLAARKREDAQIVQRLQPRRARALGEQTPWLPGAHRLRS